MSQSISRITNYASLLAAVPIWLNRQDLAAVVPVFVQLAEQEFNRVLRVRQMVRRSTTTVTPADHGFVPLPSDFLEAENFETISTDPPRVLEVLTPQRADEWRAKLDGPPVFYSIIGNQIEFVPHPTADVDVELGYYSRIPALTEQAPVNWMLSQHPDVYLYATLTHSAPYLKDDARIAVWRLAVDKFFEDVREADSRAVYGQSSPKMRPRRAF